jgi:hypothetical protein
LAVLLLSIVKRHHTRIQAVEVALAKSSAPKRPS